MPVQRLYNVYVKFYEIKTITMHFAYFTAFTNFTIKN